MRYNFPIVGIGASAGGLEALEIFFKNMPDNSEMAFVVIMHLDPSHTSLLPDLLQRQTKMEVIKIHDQEQVLPNKIYVIPPNKNLLLADHRLELIDPVDLRVKSPIDFFLKTLAQEQGCNAACVILSGTGSDGTIGLKEIKAESGFVLVQSIMSAKYDGMPKNAIATGMVDYTLAPSDMPIQLLQHFSEPNTDYGSITTDTKILTNTLSQILIIIKNVTGHDFTLYKKKTILRRIERRMQVHQISDITDYLTIIKKDKSEVNTLFQDLLIGVTSFFRDKDAFDLLSIKIIPELLDKKPDNYNIRVWVTGCSSGEEAYSVAITLQEYIATSGRNMSVQIFATDIDEYAIERARSGTYPADIINDLGEEYCKRYFIKEGENYRVKKFLREMLVFANQDLIKDPPFSKLDIICCRNLLIYFSPELQKKIFPIFHYSLKKDGILFLGPSETTGQSNHYFEIIDKKWKLFKRRAINKNSTSGLHFTESVSPLKMEIKNPPSMLSKTTELSVLDLVEAILKKNQVPPCVIVDNQMNILYVHGRLGQYLEPAQGSLNNNILEMARTPTLREELSTAIHKVILHKKDINKKSFPIEIDGAKKFLDLSIVSLQELSHLKDLVMVTFSENKHTSKENEDKSTKDASLAFQDDKNSLRKELENTRDNLQTTIEELETSNEELKSSNEELQSTNEELQSTNEELETSKEELQSLNEESVTVNAELQSHIDDLSMANDDIKNLLDSTQIATVFLDTDLKIRRFTPKITSIINLLPSDIHRPIAHLSSCLQNVKLTDVADSVLRTLEKAEIEVNDDKDKVYRMRALPYRTANNVIAGVVISFEDITKIQSTQKELQDSEQRYRSLFDNCPFTIVEIDTLELVNYIKTNNLTNIEEIESHLLKKEFESQNILKLIKVLNINNAGLSLFNNADKDSLLKEFLSIIDTRTYLLNQMKAIIEQKQNIIFNSKIKKIKDDAVEYQIIITIPKFDITAHSTNTILVLTPIR